MNKTFAKNLGRITEKLELGLEEKWIYAHYSKGTFQKTSCILKNEDKEPLDYLQSFFKDNNVTEIMQKEVEDFFMKELASPSKGRKDILFLLKAVSLHLSIGIAIAICVLAGYKLGASLDIRYSLYPVYTLIGTFTGIGVGGLAGFLMIQNYIKPSDEIRTKDHTKEKPEEKMLPDYPTIDVTMDQVRKAVREFSNDLPNGVYRTVLVKEDNSIDFIQLAHILKGIPSQQFFMSKETYDIFEEKDKNIPVEMDLVQKAVDQYTRDHKQYPMLKFDPLHRVNYYQLIQEHYLKVQPEIQFYITDLDGLVTHIKPGKKAEHSS